MSRPQGHSAVGWIRSIEKSSDIVIVIIIIIIFTWDEFLIRRPSSCTNLGPRHLQANSDQAPAASCQFRSNSYVWFQQCSEGAVRVKRGAAVRTDCGLGQVRRRSDIMQHATLRSLSRPDCHTTMNHWHGKCELKSPCLPPLPRGQRFPQIGVELIFLLCSPSSLVGLKWFDAEIWGELKQFVLVH
jgi:hypothetical protein